MGPLHHQFRKYHEMSGSSESCHYRTLATRWQHQPMREVVRHGGSLRQTSFAQTFQQMLPLSRPEGAALHYEAIGKITLSAQ